MPHHPDVHRRRSIRLPDYDYFTIGAYFVTICTFQRECLFGEVVDGEMRLNGAGEMMQQAWDALANHFRHVELDQFVIMPNHVLGIIVLTDGGRGDEGGVGAKQGSSASPGSASSDFDTNGFDVCIIQGKAGKTFALPLHGTLPKPSTIIRISSGRISCARLCWSGQFMNCSDGDLNCCHAMQYSEGPPMPPHPDDHHRRSIRLPDYEPPNTSTPTATPPPTRSGNAIITNT